MEDNQKKRVVFTPKDCNNCIFAELHYYVPNVATAYCVLPLRRFKKQLPNQSLITSKKIDCDELGVLTKPEWCPLNQCSLHVSLIPEIINQ